MITKLSHRARYYGKRVNAYNIQKARYAYFEQNQRFPERIEINIDDWRALLRDVSPHLNNWFDPINMKIFGMEVVVNLTRTSKVIDVYTEG